MSAGGNVGLERMGLLSWDMFRERVLDVVRAVPEGRVTTYGHVALLAGEPGAARQVGYILHGVKEHEDIPWQRVINAQGAISTYKVGAGDLQRALLEAEGVVFDPKGRCDLKRFGWTPDGP